MAAKSIELKESDLKKIIRKHFQKEEGKPPKKVSFQFHVKSADREGESYEVRVIVDF